MGARRRLDFDPVDPEKLVISDVIPKRGERFDRTSNSLEGSGKEI